MNLFAQEEEEEEGEEEGDEEELLDCHLCGKKVNLKFYNIYFMVLILHTTKK